MKNEELYCKFIFTSELLNRIGTIIPNEILIGEKNPVEDVDLFILEDGDCIDDRPIISVKASCSTKMENVTVPLRNKNTIFSREIIDSSIGPNCKDPKVVQRVIGIDEYENEIHENICYNFFGLGGESYEILTDDRLSII